MAPAFDTASPERALPRDSSEDPRGRQLEQRARRDLEWDELLEGIARRSSTALGRARILGLGPLPSELSARHRWVLSSEAIELARQGVEFPVFTLPDAEPALERILRGGIASGPELHQVRLALRAAGELARFLSTHKGGAPTLAEHLRTEPALGAVRDELERCLEGEGELADRASPELALARRKLTQLRQQVRGRLGELIGRYREALQDAFIAERDGRYVLPVRADAPFRVPGIVLGSSASGATLYVEPQEIAELGNRLKVAEADAEHQEAVVLATLSELILPSARDALDALTACAEADALRAIELYARATRAQMLAWGAPGSLRLVGARHPLLALEGGAVVTNDLAIAAGEALVLSGPNAGGKTVALKCLGLAALAQASGLPVPVDGESSGGFFEGIFSDIGDDQSLARSLSTFSGHIETVRDIVDRAAPCTLVLLDEVAGGTDPEEGAALAVAIVEGLIERRAAVVVTTHYERLKELASESETVENAAVGFDFERLEPTFRVTLGRPGASSALWVARRHGLSATVVDRAGELVPEISKRREQLLQELERKQQQLEQLRADIETEKERLAELSESLELEQRRRAERERGELSRAGQELSRAVREARAEVHRVARSLSEPIRDRQELREAERSIDRAARLVALGGELDQRTRKGPFTRTSEGELVVGQRVRVHGMNTIAVVIEPPQRGQVRVLAGAMKLTVSVDQVEVLGGAKVAQKPARSAPQRASRLEMSPAAEDLAPPRTTDVTLDLRGERVEAAFDRMDAFIDVLLRRGEGVGFILHGHGSGALKAAARARLQEHALVRSARPAARDEGGDAFTVFWLND